VGFAGCNLRCPFCQNWRISQTTDVRGETLSPAELIAAAGSGGFDQIAYTYSEPLVHAEYLLDCMALARRAGIANVLVSNGCVTPEAAADILALTDAANVDLKAFSSDTYARVLGGDLAAVLAFIEKARALGVHLEITTLMVPGLNDGGEETGKYIEFIRGLSPDTPWHLSAYHPDYRWDAPPTDPRRLAETARRARRDLKYVYTGNTGESNATPCPHCGGVLVERRNYRIRTELGVKKTASGRAYYCGHCGKPVPFIVG
jgi:pyruvate formate lyase activating enzyme